MEGIIIRLWHYKLISKLDCQRLLGQNRECAALRGLGWNRKHSTVDYVFKHSYSFLFRYHLLVMIEMDKRGYKVNPLWLIPEYRGKKIGFDKSSFTALVKNEGYYPEHDDDYLKECLDNLHRKGVFI